MEPVILQKKKKKMATGFLLYLKAFSWEIDLWVTLGEFMVKKRQIGKKNPYLIKDPTYCWKRGCLLLTKIKAKTVKTFFVCVCEILKILIGNMLNSMKESPTFYPF